MALAAPSLLSSPTGRIILLGMWGRFAREPLSPSRAMQPSGFRRSLYPVKTQMGSYGRRAREFVNSDGPISW
jgi:hypothetical protein